MRLVSKSLFMRLSIHLSENQRIIVFLVFIVIFFMFLGVVDWNIRGWRDPKKYDFIIVKDVPSYWVVYWGIGMPLYAILVTVAYKISSHSSNLVAFGLFMTVMFLWWGQLEDFFFFTLGAHGYFPDGVWDWFVATPYWILGGGTWNTALHFRCLAAFVIATTVMWAFIFKFRKHQ